MRIQRFILYIFKCQFSDGLNIVLKQVRSSKETYREPTEKNEKVARSCCSRSVLMVQGDKQSSPQ